jgi:MFS family permease
MYSIDWSKVFSRKQRAGSAPAGAKPSIEVNESKQKGWLPTVSKTVWALGFTSLLTDISSEMVASILPVYLVLYLGISPVAFGMLDGIYQGAAALVSVVSGVLADRWRRHKEVAALGYGLSAACRLLILVAGNAWGIIAAIITLDRIGKGIRTAPRDSLISQRSPEPELATAFGVHRAMDAAGAMLGPVLAFALLALMPRRFDVLFVASFGVAIIGLGSITLFVPSVVTGERQISRTPDSLGKALQLLGDARFRVFVFTGAVLGLATISESFIFLMLQRRFDVGISAFPLLYVGTSLFTSAFAIPCGRLADRLGRTRVLLGGYGVLAMVYLILLLPAAGGLLLIAAVVFLLGFFYAATDGVLTAMAAAALPMEHSGSGLAVLATATNLARLAASVTFGLLWSHAGIGPATVCYLLALAVAILGAYFVLNRPKQHVI